MNAKALAAFIAMMALLQALQALADVQLKEKERAKAQGANDLAIFIMMTLS